LNEGFKRLVRREIVEGGGKGGCISTEMLERGVLDSGALIKTTLKRWTYPFSITVLETPKDLVPAVSTHDRCVFHLCRCSVRGSLDDGKSLVGRHRVLCNLAADVF
jgi:hypothetical protein